MPEFKDGQKLVTMRSLGIKGKHTEAGTAVTIGTDITKDEAQEGLDREILTQDLSWKAPVKKESKKKVDPADVAAMLGQTQELLKQHTEVLKNLVKADK